MSVSDIRQRLHEHVPGLAPAHPWSIELDREIDALAEGSEPLAALKSGLHLWNSSLDASHRLSQNLENPLGSYWHGIMHRMEGDYSNANYWFARAGRHSIHLGLQEAAAEALATREKEWQHAEPIGLRSKLEALRYAPVWNPATFTSAVELCVRSGDNTARLLLEAIQYEEIRRLAAYCYDQSGGGKEL